MKRKRSGPAALREPKRLKTDRDASKKTLNPLLQRYYPEVVTLRHYLASRLAKQRKRKLQQYGRNSDPSADTVVVALLDTTLVGASKPVEADASSFVEQDIVIFTQQLSAQESTVSSLTVSDFNQKEIVDFVIWHLFRRQFGMRRPRHLLCQNFQKYLNEYSRDAEPEIVPGIPGIYASGPNENVQILKGPPWSVLPTLLGKGAERILTDLLVDCGIFSPIPDSSNLTQISGLPLCDLEILSCPMDAPLPLRECREQHSKPDQRKGVMEKRGLSNIRFVRHRLLFARPSSIADAPVRFGLKQIHVLNRCHNLDDVQETRHVMKHIFPLQFGLHNVFTSDVDPEQDAQPFKDYTVREEEISRMNKRCRQKKDSGLDASMKPSSLPKRLRGVERLVHRLRKRHFRCSYSTLLNHYCPRAGPDEEGAESPVRRASSAAQVSAFCRAAVVKVFPKELWGVEQNVRTIGREIDRFVRLRRFETITLHDVVQSMTLDGVTWLASPKVNQTNKLSKTDFEKRKELLAELLYYLFDSFIIPLIRSHFHVTETNFQRNQLVYFRHDDWRDMSWPALTSLQRTMLEECNTTMLKQQVEKRALGVSHVRLLPKERGMRPIINLRRRAQKLQFGQVVLGKSINNIMTPVFSVLNHEKTASPGVLGAALFSVDEIFPRLQRYQQSLAEQGFHGKPLYFAKVDVQACFDTIPQKRLLQMAERIIRAEEYHVTRYSRATLLGGHDKKVPAFGAKPFWRFLTKASSGNEPFDFRQEVKTDTAEGRNRAIYINGIAQRSEGRQALLALLKEHVESNLIKIGGRFYRQRKGIPQGSIVSSLLCNYFYAELEREHLSFVGDGNSLLLRLIDDFLVISTERRVAERFLRTMHAGVAEFGIQVKAEKSRANFDVQIDGTAIATTAGSSMFPYCGLAIHVRTLDLSKDRERRRHANIADSLTVEYSKLPGQSFYRKTLSALKLQMHDMLLSTTYNSIETVFANLFHSFTEVAQKTYHYIKSLPRAKRPPCKLVIRTFDELVKVTCAMMRGHRRTGKDMLPYECCVTNWQARWLACSAFEKVFRRRQTKHGRLLGYLSEQLGALQLQVAMNGEERKLLGRATRNA